MIDEKWIKVIIWILIICGISILYGFATAKPVASAEAPGPAQDRFISDWIRIEPGECVITPHGLPNRPMIVQVWVRPYLAERYPTMTVLPIDYYEFELALRFVSKDGIEVCSQESIQPRYIQIVAED